MNTDELQGKRFFIVDEDQLRAKILELEPGIRHDADVMAEVIRESVKLEREKLGLDNPKGVIELWPNKDKRQASDQDWVGVGRVCGRSYRAAGWISKDGVFRISLLPQKRK
jgi:hypothetical protein